MTLAPGGGTYLLFNKQTGQAVGINNGYSRIGIRHAIFEDGPQQVFGEAHALITDTNRYGFNAGLGYRMLMDDALWGVNGWYDTIESPQAFTYQQVGMGVEYLSDSLDLRANGYVPFGNQENFLNVTNPGTQTLFTGHDFSTLGRALFQQALTGFDAEAGIPLPVVNWLRVYAGFYHLNFNQDETWGVRSRIEGRLTQGVNLNFQVTNDDKFGTNLNVGVDVRFDGRLPTRFGADTDAESRRYEQVRRQWQVQLAQNEGPRLVPLNDRATGNQIVVSWIDNTSAAGGDGTFERPYKTLPSSARSNYVMVRRGAGDTVGNITLRDGQDLFGEGKQHFIDTVRLGLTAVPDRFFDNTGAFPTLRAGNAAAPVITLADGNIVSGFNILGGTTAAISGTGTDNFLIECVNATSASGISIVDGGGVGIIRDSSFVNNSPAGVGIAVTNTSGPRLDLSIHDVTTEGGATGISVRGAGAPFNVSLKDIQGSDHTNAGVILGATGPAGVMGATVENVALTNVGDGFRFDVASGGALSGSVTNVSATGSGNLLEGNVNTGALNLTVTDATLSNSTGGSGVSLNLANATGRAVFDNLTADGNAVDGVATVASGATTVYNIQVHDSSLVGNTDDAFDVTVVGGANVTTLVDPTEATGSGNNGFEFDVQGAGSRLTATKADTNFSTSGNDGVNGRVTNGGRADLIFDRSPASGSGHNGLDVVVDNGSTLNGVFRNGSFSQSGVLNNGVGINAVVSGNSTATLNFESTAASGNGATGLAYAVSGGSDLIANFTDGDLSNNPINNVIGSVDGVGSTATLSFDNTNANSLAANGGFEASVTAGAALTSTWTNSDISGTQGDGVRVVGTGNGTNVGLTFNNSLIDNNGGNGLIASLTGGNNTSSLGVVLNDSGLTGNGRDGLNLSVDGLGVRGTADINSTPITGNAQDGLDYNVTGGARFSTAVAGTGNDFSRNGESGIDGFVSGANSVATVSVDSANINNSGQSGVLLVSEQAGRNLFTLSNANVIRSGIHGVDATASTNGLQTVNLSNVNIQRSQGNGYRFDADTGGDIAGSVLGGTIRLNGGVPASGVRGTVNGTGSTAFVTFDAVQVTNNTLHGFELNSTGGGLLNATMRSGVEGTLLASNNVGDGIVLTANGAGSIANLLMFGESSVSGNAGNGLRVSGVDARQVAVQFSGGANNNGGDGIQVSLNNVNRAAVELTSLVNSTIDGNGGDGIDLSLVNTDLTDLTVNGTLVESLQISGLTIQNNAGVGVKINADNSDLGTGAITGNTIRDNAGGGLTIDLLNGSDWNLDVTDNSILDNGGTGILLTSTGGTSAININGNTLAGSLIDNIRVDLAGSSSTLLNIDGNTVDGDGVNPSITPTVLRTILSPIDSAFFTTVPPDASGAVGFNDIVELGNGNFRVYDKTSGTLLLDITDEQFWRSTVGANLLGSTTHNHRIIYDRSTNRWIATTVTTGNGNQILLAISNSDDPTGGWQSVQWQGDLTAATSSDFVTLGLDADSVVISTTDGTGATQTASVFTIPKADLFNFNPSIFRMTRLQGLTPVAVGTALQAAVDFGASDGRTAILSVNDTLNANTQIIRTSVLGGTTSLATLSPATPITVPNFNAPNNVATPSGGTLGDTSTKIWANTIEVNNELWAVHNVRGAGGLNEIRWYRIDESTSAVIATGAINAPGLSLFFPSIAVNNSGEVIISYNAGSSTTAPSAYASAGIIQGNNVVFGAPTLIAAGTGEYGGNSWGEYSSTVVDPANSNRFWSILEIGRGATDGFADFDFGQAITQLDVSVVAGSTNTTAGNGIHVTARDNAIIRTGSSFNDNTVAGHGGDGIALDLSDNSTLGDFTIDGNSVTDNGGDGIRVTTTGGQTVGDLSISNNVGITNNGGDGIQVDLLSAAGVPNIIVDRNTVTDNGQSGITINAIDTVTGSINITNNTVSGNQGGVVANVINTVQATTPIEINVTDNTISGNTGIGLDLTLTNLQLSLLNVRNNVIGTNTDDGLRVRANNSPITLAEISDNRLIGNGGNEAMFLSFTDGPIGTLSVKRNTLGGALVDGMRIDLDHSPVGSVEIVSNNAGGGGGTSAVIDDALPVIRAGFNGNTIPSNDDGSSPITPLGFTADFFGQTFTDTFVNNNGNITFGSRLATFTPFGLLSTTSRIIAPFFADVDTTDPNGVITPDVTFGTGTVAGRPAFGANWIDVRHFSVFGSNNGLPANSFQLVLIDRSDIGAGDFDIEFNYGQILWEAGTASGGNAFGLGGTSATVGYSNGTTTALEFPGSRVNGALLDSGPALTSLVQNALNSMHAGRYVFFARNGDIGTVGGGSGGDGITLNINNGSDIGAMLIDNNQVRNNGVHGIDINVADSTLPTSVQISRNVVVGQGGSGISIDSPDTNGTPFGIDFIDNEITDNTGGPGIEINLGDNAGSTFQSTFTGNTVNENGEEGIRLNLSQNITANITNFSDNTVNSNEGIGFHLNATDNSQYTLVMGTSGHNTFDGNAGAGLAVTQNGNTVGQLTIADSQFDNTVNGLNAAFGGEGIHINLADNAILSNLVIGDPAPGTSSATGNDSHGVQIFVDGFSQLTNPTIQNMTINTNGGDGINIERRGLGVIDNFVINANTLDQNTGDGLDIRARAGNLTDEYTITNNTINRSTGRGIGFRVDGDADMTTNLDGNTITNNGGTGITVESTVNAGTDTPTFTGTWLASTITGNAGRGVDINSPGHIIQIGDATAAFPDTVINNNILGGVLVRSTGTLDLDNVQINNNRGTGVQFQGGTGGLMTLDRAEISNNTRHGVDLEMRSNTLSITNSTIASNTLDGILVQSFAGVNDVMLDNNIVTMNGQDGLEVINNSAAGLTATITNSRFNSNTERGVAIFNRGNGLANITLDDNQFLSNGEEGVYVVNTASADQDTRANATDVLSSNGLVSATPDLVFAMNRNTVSANGLSSAFSATGLVVRVGTADGGSADFTDAGGFADTRAGVTATVRDNTLQGNAGSDVHFESFVSTVNPLASIGTWDAGTFAITQYQTDPLARLDLVYGNNVADSTQATNIGASFNNDESVFKSRTTGQTPAGPFASGTRDRNAQRLADRNVAPGGLLLNPNVPQVAPNYLYSGVGGSTFRVNLEPGNVFGTGTGFQQDVDPFVDINDYNGIGALTELFGWGTLP